MESHSGAGDRATFLDTIAAGLVIRLSPRTLEGLRVRGGGPAFRRHSGRVRYCLADLIAWSEAGRRASTSDEGPTQPGQRR